MKSFLPKPLDTLPVLVVAPHLDDAVLSAFALARSGPDATVLTVFDGEPQPPVVTSWDLVCSLRDSAEAMRLRRAENLDAMRRTGCDHRTVGLVDQQYLEGQRCDDDAEMTRAAVQEWLNEVGSGVVAIPAGAGCPPAPSTAVLGTPGGARRRQLRRLVGPAGQALLNARARRMAQRTRPTVHVDHLFVRDALVPLSVEAAVLLYEEIPYLWGEPGDRSVTELATRNWLRTQQFTVEIDRADKARCIAAYRTQIPLLYARHGRLDSAAGLPSTERYWLLTGR